MPQTLRFLVALLIQPHFHPMPKGEGLSRSGRAVIHSFDDFPSPSNTFKISNLANGATPITPALFSEAAIIPATCVPCPWLSKKLLGSLS